MRKHTSSARETLSELNAKDMLNASRCGRIVVEERLTALRVVCKMCSIATDIRIEVYSVWFFNHFLLQNHFKQMGVFGEATLTINMEFFWR